MSNNELEKHKMMYSQLVEELVHLHNNHLRFLRIPSSIMTLRDIRKSLKTIQKVARAINMHTKLVYSEGLDNKRENKRIIRQSKITARKRKEKKNVNNNSTSGTI
jgi:hypothetical protein